MISVKPIVLGLLTALAGITLGLIPPLADLETDLGLAWLFEMRGPRLPPGDVVIVAIDHESAERFGLPNIPRHWPRSLHARLVERLTEAGAVVIAFDIHFGEPSDSDQDRRFADAIQAAGNVVLFDYLKSPFLKDEQRLLKNVQGKLLARVNIEQPVPPIAVLAEAAAATAPFPLPKVPIRVNRYWLFKDGLGDIPTLPVVALAIKVLPQCADLLHLLRVELPDVTGGLPYGYAKPLLQTLHGYFNSEPDEWQQPLSRLREGNVPNDPSTRSVTQLLGLFTGGDSRYLDYYGPPRTITTIPFHRVLEAPLDLNGKAVFVGFSENFQPEQQDYFYTVFSLPDGVYLSGVEIAATAYANLLENRSVHPLPPGWRWLLLASWGMLAGAVCFVFPASQVMVAIVVFAASYIGAATTLFGLDGLWLPLVLPLLVQLPFAVAGSMVWRYRSIRQESMRIFQAFGYFLPGRVVTELVRDLQGVERQGRLIEGISLATDADRYTALSTRLPPERLRELLNRYFATLFRPVRRSGGFISDVVGDAMMAIWEREAGNDRRQRKRVCEATLDILDAVWTFNRRHPQTALPTRFGLHCGSMYLGHVGGVGHYEYRAVGDVVNTTWRIQTLSKQLDTRVLVSVAMIDGLDGLCSRPIGEFVLLGREEPIAVHELIGRAEDVDGATRNRCARFALALQAFREGCWEHAAALLRALLKECPEDGPARYYLALSQEYAAHPPNSPWDGVIHLNRK